MAVCIKKFIFKNYERLITETEAERGREIVAMRLGKARQKSIKIIINYLNYGHLIKVPFKHFLAAFKPIYYNKNV